MDDALVTRPVNDDGGGTPRRDAGKQSFGAAKVTQSFFTGRRGEKEWPHRTDPATRDCAGDGKHGCESTSIVTNARADESVAIGANREISAPWKNGVEMREHADRRLGRSACCSRDDVAHVIDVDLVSKARQTAADPLRAFPFVTRGSGDLGHAHLRT